MVEDIEKIITNGFETYTKNLNLSIPFILSLVIIGSVALVIFLVGFVLILGSSLASLGDISNPEFLITAIIPFIMRHILEIAFLMLIIFLISMLFYAFFTAGAIGMAKQANETGKTELSTMMEAGKKNFINLFLAEVLVALIFLAGIIFIVPGAMKLNIAQLASQENQGAILLMAGGFLLWMIYLIILSIVLAVFTYVLVIENLGPIEGITAGFRFFRKNKIPVILLWVIMIAISVALMVVDQIMGFIPIINFLWFFVSIGINFVIFPALTTVWWVRFYMTRTDKTLYFNELLAHPSDLEAAKANQ